MSSKTRLQKIEQAIQKQTMRERVAPTIPLTDEYLALWEHSLKTLAQALTEDTGEQISAAEVQSLLRELR